MKEAVIEVRGLAKRYGRTVAVDGLDLDVPRGVCYGLLGPNGAGKTTTLRALVGLVRPDAGTVTILGLDAAREGRRVRARMALVPQEANLDLEATTSDNLLIYARFFGIPRVDARRRADELLAFVGLSEKRDEVVERLSGGMKRRLLIARALVNDPELLVLDEPTTGLDPQSRALLWEKIRALRTQGKTILLTTHYMEEAERLCDELVIVDQGRVIARGAPAALVADRVRREVLEVRTPDPERAERAAGERAEAVGDVLLFTADDAEVLLQRLHAAGVPVEYALARRATLEDVFLSLTGRRMRE
ncbi:MAG TPA: ATP-binding cassette domain-containing protein [Candidatus Thermoplasmatota archaeon]|nr:ATP-binding cassette domain-containing protein [Candidatus Thermoplasmatota archaeon]